MKKSPMIAVTGAAGYTAGFAVRYLLARGFTPIAIARESDFAKLDQYDERVIRRKASFDNKEEFDEALKGAEAILHLAGPFKEHAEIVVEAAIRNKIHYLDIAAEQGPVKNIFEKFDQKAKEAGIVALPGFGQFGGYPDLIATALMEGWDSADVVETYTGFDKWHLTQGSRNTFAGVGNLEITQGKLTPKTEDEEKHWYFASPVGTLTQDAVISAPINDSIVLHSHLNIRKYRHYLNKTAITNAMDPNTPLPVSSDSLGRDSQNFIVDVVVKKNGVERRAYIKGVDGYAATAALHVFALEQLLSKKDIHYGVKAPGAVFKNAHEFLMGLDPQYSTYRKVEAKKNNDLELSMSV